MNARTLLELAARAAGILGEVEEFYSSVYAKESYLAIGTENGAWSTLRDDGDCARLEAACEINVDWLPDMVICVAIDQNEIAHQTHEKFSGHGGDINKARRYASTRAAAQLAQQETAK